MKFGIIGSGMVAKFHAKAIQALGGSELRSIYNRNSASSRAIAAEDGGVAHVNVEAFLLEDTGLAIVTISHCDVL